MMCKYTPSVLEKFAQSLMLMECYPIRIDHVTMLNTGINITIRKPLKNLETSSDSSPRVDISIHVKNCPKYLSRKTVPLTRDVHYHKKHDMFLYMRYYLT
jgi:hypothetical protein